MILMRRLVLTKIESFRLLAIPLDFGVDSISFRPIDFIVVLLLLLLLFKLAAATAAAAIFPRVEMKRCIKPFLAGLTWNRGAMPGTKICGVDVVRDIIFDATPDVVVVFNAFGFGVAVIAF